MDVIYINIPTAKKQKFKRMCKAEGLSMREWFLLKLQPELDQFEQGQNGTA